MKSLNLRLVDASGDELEFLPVEQFVIAEAWDDIPQADSEDSILDRVEGLYSSLLTLLRERQASPSHGLVWLKITLGEALLSANEMPGEEVVIDVPVSPLTLGEEDEFDESF
jgi:hypothetical protein